MLTQNLESRLRTLSATQLPVPGAGSSAERHRRLFAVGREDLSLARMAEAHWDAIAILAEARREPKKGSIYGVWASEKPGEGLTVEYQGQEVIVRGSKMFATGAGIVDRALVTVSVPCFLLLDIDLRANSSTIIYDYSGWKTLAFAETRTASAHFNGARAKADDLVGEPQWYFKRPGFWHGAICPAACWAGGAAGLLDYAISQSRHDPHTLAHLGAMHACIWALTSYLDAAGSEIDLDANDFASAKIRALTVRHLVEQACTEVLRRFSRAYGPHPLAMNEDVSRRYQELDLYLKQSHAERDLALLGESLHTCVPAL